MSANRYALRKDANQGDIVDTLRRIGCSVVVLHAPSDLLVGYRGRNVLLEVKDGNKPPSARKLTTDQVIFRAEWRGQYDVVQNEDEAIAAVQRHTLSR